MWVWSYGYSNNCGSSRTCGNWNGSKDALAEFFLHYFIEVVSLHSDIWRWIDSDWTDWNLDERGATHWTNLEQAQQELKYLLHESLKKVPERNLQSFLSHVSNLGAVRESSGGIFSSRSWPCNRAPLGRRRPVWVRSSSSVRRSSPTTPASGWSSRPAPRRRTSRPRASSPKPRWTSSEKFEDKEHELTALKFTRSMCLFLLLVGT